MRTGLSAKAILERRLVIHLIDELLGQGLAISVFDGGEDHPVTTDRQEVIDAVMETDEDYLNIYADGVTSGWIRLVYGNGEFEVICDNTLSAEPYFEKTWDIRREDVNAVMSHPLTT